MTIDVEQTVNEVKKIRRKKNIKVLAEVVVGLCQSAITVQDIEIAKDMRRLLDDLITEEMNRIPEYSSDNYQKKYGKEEE